MDAIFTTRFLGSTALTEVVTPGRQSHYILISFPLDEILVLNTNLACHRGPAAYLLLLKCVLVLLRRILLVESRGRCKDTDNCKNITEEMWGSDHAQWWDNESRAWFASSNDARSLSITQSSF